MKRSRFSLLVLGFVLTLPTHASRAEITTDKGFGGHVLAEVEGRKVLFPTLKTEITGDLEGDLATITVRQTFANPTQTPMNARYLFPLNKDAAVHAMQMQVGDELVTAEIAEKKEARRSYETAKSEGKSAALLEQHRPNMFTQEIANLMPGMPVTVTLEYSQIVPRLDGAYELRVPLVVGPRYIPNGGTSRVRLVDHATDEDVAIDDRPPTATEVGDTKPVGLGQWGFGPVPDYPDVAGLTIPPLVDKDRVSLTINLSAGMPIGNVSSASHTLDVSGDETAKVIALGGGATMDNRDFVLRYALASDQPVAGLLTHQGPDGGTFSLLIEPPKAPREGDIAPREMVFVLDSSGSMSGAPMEASKTFMRHALKTLRPADFFRIIRFSNEARELSTGALSASPANIQAGNDFVDRLTADGGTEILRGLQQAYIQPQHPDVLRIVVFLSDGYVGNEAEILRLVSEEVDKGRLYAFGVGTSVNRYLIAEMARLGRGLSRIIDPTVGGQEEAITFAGHLKTPVLTDIDIDWGELAPEEITPAFIPDLFAGESIRVQGKFAGTASHVVKVRGRVNGRAVTMPLEIKPSAASDAGGKAIPLIWARSKIADHMRELMIPMELRQSGLSDQQLERNVTELGLAHALVTQWTSFVAVSQRIVNPEPASAVSADVPLPMVKGVTKKAYPQQPEKRLQHASSGGEEVTIAFSGGSTPEPEHVFGLLVLLLPLLGVVMRRGRRVIG